MRNTIKKILCSAILFSGSSVLSMQDPEEVTESSFLRPIKMVRFLVKSMQGDARKLTGIFEEDQKYLRELSHLNMLPLERFPNLLNDYKKALEYHDTLDKMRVLASSFEPFFFCNFLENSKLKLRFPMPKDLSYVIVKLLGKEYKKIKNFVFNNLRLSFVRHMISEPFSKMVVSDEDKNSLMIVKKIVENWDIFTRNPKYENYIETPSSIHKFPPLQTLEPINTNYKKVDENSNIHLETLEMIDEEISEAQENSSFFINLELNIQDETHPNFILGIAQRIKNIKKLKLCCDPNIRSENNMLQQMHHGDVLEHCANILVNYIQIGDFPHSLIFDKFKMTKKVKMQKENDTLKKLSFQDCRLYDPFLIVTDLLKFSTKLEVFSIKKTQSYGSLNWLEVQNNARDFVSFSKAVGAHSTLTKLILKHTSFNHYSANLLVKALEKNQRIKTFKIGGALRSSIDNDYYIDDKAAELFLKFLEKATWIKTFSFYRGLPKKIEKKKSKEAENALIDALKKNKTLTSLNYTFSDLDIGCMSKIALGISESKSIQKLKFRNGAYQKNNEDSIAIKKLLTPLMNNTKLTSLKVRRFALYEDGFNSLNNFIKSNKTLTTLNIEVFSCEWDSKKITDLFDALSENKTLLNVTFKASDALYLSNTEIFQACAQSIPEYIKTNQSIRSFVFFDYFEEPLDPATVKIFEDVWDALKKNINSKIENLQLLGFPDKEDIQKIKDRFGLTTEEFQELNKRMNLEKTHDKIEQVLIFEPIQNGIEIEGQVEKETEEKRTLKRKRN